MRARAIFIFGLTLMIAAAALEHHSEQRAFGASTRAVKMGKIKQELIKNQGDHPPDVHKFFLIDTVLIVGHSLFIVSIGSVAGRTSPRIAIAATMIGFCALVGSRTTLKQTSATIRTGAPPR